MNCDVARDRILEAEPAELRGQASTELARHLGDCERCAAVAGALLVELERLDAGLDAWARSADSDAAVDAVLAEAGRGSARRRPAWRRLAWIPLAAAAGIAGILLLPRAVPVPDTVGPPVRVDPAVAVQPPADRGAVVMKTSNPNITIVWLYERGDT